MGSIKAPKLYKRVTLKIFPPQHDKPHIQVLKANPGTRFGKEEITDILAAAALEIAEAFPRHQYKLVPIGPNAFNFLPTGSRVDIAETPKDIAAQAS